MARNKYPEQTINRILDISFKLFLEKGYEQTTIQDIVDELDGLSRGAIYHHFKSKDEIIEAVTARIFYESNPYENVKKEKGLTGLQKIKRVLLESLINDDETQIYVAAPTLLNNPKFLAQQLNQCVSILAPMVKELIDEGVADGSITALHSKALSEILMLLFNVWMTPTVFPVTKVEYYEKILCIKTLLDNIGLPIIDDEVLSSFEKFSDIVLSPVKE